MTTARGFDFYEVSSALQKAVRRADAVYAGYWAIELFQSGYAEYVWKRLFTISAEDCWGVITQEINALRTGYLLVNHNVKREGRALPKGRIFIAKAVIILCMARKSRDADHLTNLIYDREALEPKALKAELAALDPAMILQMPTYAYDVHTMQGKRRGKTKDDFFRDEQKALNPLEPGLFDTLVPE